MLIYTDRFWHELDTIVDFIELDSTLQGEKFAEGVQAACETLEFMPYKCRKSLNFNDESVRDLVFKGYVLPYRVKDDNIYILGIYKENVWQP